MCAPLVDDHLCGPWAVISVTLYRKYALFVLKYYYQFCTNILFRICKSLAPGLL